MLTLKETQDELRPGRAGRGGSLLIVKAIGDTMECFN